MKKIVLLVLTFPVLFLVLGCASRTSGAGGPEIDPLPSWNLGEVKTSLITFIEMVSDPGSDGFVPVEDRIAVFDNDGNLWSEKPYYFQLQFAMDRVREEWPNHPEWVGNSLFEAAYEGNMDEVLAFGHHGLMELVMASHTGMDTREFETMVRDWLASTSHPRFGVGYNEMIYQPMTELLDYLAAREFKVFIVSGGGIDFLRVWAEEAYGIPRDRIVGSSIVTAYDYEANPADLIRIPEINFVNDKEGKPVGIHHHIGRRPILASGNSDGDLAMLRYTAAGDGPRYMLYLHHTDDEREWAYDRDSSVGRLDEGLDEAQERNWSVIDMKEDWKVIYPFQLQD